MNIPPLGPDCKVWIVTRKSDGITLGEFSCEANLYRFDADLVNIETDTQYYGRKRDEQIKLCGGIEYKMKEGLFLHAYKCQFSGEIRYIVHDKVGHIFSTIFPNSLEPYLQKEE